HHGAIEFIHVVDVGRTGGREITLVGEIWPLLELNTADELGNEKTGIGVPVRVRAGRRVDRHARDGRGEVGAVVEVEATEIVLIRLALATMLADDEPRYRLEHFARTHHGARRELSGRDGSLARR